MSKRTNTLWFILGATAFNILLTLVWFILLTLLYAVFLAPHVPEGAAHWSLSLTILAALLLSWAAYRLALRLLLKRINPARHFAPLFKKQEANRGD
ncbi:MAG: leader peptide processing enzyme [Treponema sp.]|jgi:hypothetical protein|nr:leader peptide processing enzyme [Treponema sp.]